MRRLSARATLVLVPLVCALGDAAGQSRAVFAVFDALDMPGVEGHGFVEYTVVGYVTGNDAGQRVVFERATGWLLAESDDEVTLLGANLMSETFRRDRALPSRRDEFKHTIAKGEVLPGELRERDFEAYCRDFMASAGRNDSGWNARRRRGELPHPANTALLAYWAREIGRDLLAARLMQHALRSVRETWIYRKEAPRGLAGFVAARVGGNLRWQAINAANRGAPRRDLLDMWLRIGRLPGNKFSGEAAEMVAQYRALMAEDEERRAPADGGLEGASPAERAARWTRALSDLDARQMMQPGMCCVTGAFSGVDGPNAAEELVALGWDALPTVIRHLDDPRPTRSVGYWRDFSIESFYLLRYGDCCQQIFQAITGKSIYNRSTTSGYPIRDGKGASAKAEALRWWEANRNDAAGHFERLLAVGAERESSFAAVQLLRTDAAKHLPAVLARARAEAARGRTTMLVAITPYLDPDLLAGLVASPPPDVVLAAARELLDRFGDARGVAALARRLRLLTTEQAGRHRFSLSGAFELLARARDERVAKEMRSLVMHQVPEVRREALDAARHFAFERLCERLASQLDDRGEADVRRKWTRVRWCDVAAESLCKAAGCPVAFDAGRPVAERDDAIARIGAWWRRNRATLDWPGLRREVEERLAAPERRE